MKRGILILGFFLVSVLAVFDVVAPEYVDMGFDNINTDAGTLDVVVNTSFNGNDGGFNVYGFQFLLKGATIADGSVTAGDMVADWDYVSNTGNSLYGLDLDQEYFDEDGILLSLGLSNYLGPLCFDLGIDTNEDGWDDYNVLADMSGEQICACWSDVCVGTYCECSCVKGDLNGDGLWNVLDIVALANCVLGNNCDDQSMLACPGDLNGDNYWNILDIVQLANCVLANSCDD